MTNKAEDSTFSDLKIRLFPKIQMNEEKLNSSKSKLDKYDSMLVRNLPLREKVDIIQKRSFEKFFRGIDKPTKEATFSTRRLNNLQSSVIRTERNLRTQIENQNKKEFSVKHINKKNIFTIDTNSSNFQASQLENVTLNELRHQKYRASLLLPEKSMKTKMATSLVELKHIIEECKIDNSIPNTPVLKKLLDCYEGFVSDESYYSNTMQSFVHILKRSIFVSDMSRLQGISDLLQLKNKEVNSFMFTEAGDAKLSHFECSQKILKAFLAWTSEASSKITDLESTIKGNHISLVREFEIQKLKKELFTKLW